MMTMVISPRRLLASGLVMALGSGIGLIATLYQTAGFSLLGGAAIVGLLLRPLIGIWLLVFTSPMNNLFIDVVDRYGISLGRTVLPSDILLLTVLSGLVLRVMIKRRRIFQWRAIDTLMMLWLAWVIQSGFRGLFLNPETVFLSARQYSVFFIYFAARFMLPSVERVSPWVFRVGILSAIPFLAEQLLAVYLLQMRGEWVIATGFSRPELLFTGSVFLYPLVFSLAEIRWRITGLHLWVPVICMSLSITGVFLSLTRSLWGAAVLGVAIFFLLVAGRNLGRYVTGILVVTLAVVTLSWSLNHLLDGRLFNRIMETSMASEEWRESEYRTVPYTVFQSIDTALIGRGLGATVSHQGMVPTPTIHNVYLNVLNATGVIGVLLFLSLWGSLLSRALAGRKDPAYGALSTVVSVLTIAYMAQSVLAGQLISISVTPMLLILAAVMVGRDSNLPTADRGGAYVREAGTTYSPGRLLRPKKQRG